MVAPAIPQLMSQFHFESDILGSFIVSIYILGYVFGPLVVAPLSELYGRLPIYHFCNIGFIVTSIACAVSTNVHMLIGFRFLSGTFGSSPIAYVGEKYAISITLKFNHAWKLTER
jgi:MFS family permease